MNVSVIPQNNILIRIYKEVNRLGFNKTSIILTQLKIGVSERCQMSLLQRLPLTTTGYVGLHKLFLQVF